MDSLKVLKKRARSTVKHHYFLLVLLCLLAVFWGVEFNSAGNLADGLNSAATTNNNPFISESSSGVLEDITNNDLSKGVAKSSSLLQQYKDGKDSTSIRGRTRGSLAGLVNNISSGQLYVKVANALLSITHSGKAVAVIFILLAMTFYLMIWIFVKNVYKAVMRRMFLEARIYKKVPFSHTIHLLAVKRWIRASVTLFITHVFNALWWLTIVGGVIKTFSYFMVPYIVAENPDIKPLEAITLSRKMMDGHKWQCFLYKLSFVGWYIASIFTLGLLSMFYVIPYEISTFSEYYSSMRTLSKENKIPGAEMLNDEYLFTKADNDTLKKAYADIVDNQNYIDTHEIKINTFQRLVAEWLGIWLGRTSTKNAYQEIENIKYQIGSDKEALETLSYPARMNPLYIRKHAGLAGRIQFLRSYSLWNLILMFFIFSFLGWCWEVSLHLINDGEFVNRGTMFGPWLPIYGYGGLIVLVLLSKLRKIPVAELIGAIVLCGCLEYFSSYYLEMKYNMRWWDYTGYFLNLDGRICAEGLLVFAIAGMVIVYLIAPINDMLFSRIKLKILIPLVLCLLVLFTIDSVHSSTHPNMGKGVTDYNAYKAKTSAVMLYDQALTACNIR